MKEQLRRVEKQVPVRAGQNAALRRVSPRLAALRAVMTSPGLVLPTNLDRLAFR